MAQPKTVVKKVARSQYVGRLKAHIRLFERRYEVSSDEMRWAVKKGFYPETSEISKWLQEHQILSMLVAGNGTHTTTTNGSMKKS